MDGFVGALITGVVIVVVAFAVVLIVRNRMKKKTEEFNKPPEVVESEMQALIAKAKADMEKDKQETGAAEKA